jgi:hypothetical protein
MRPRSVKDRIEQQFRDEEVAWDRVYIENDPRPPRDIYEL